MAKYDKKPPVTMDPANVFNIDMAEFFKTGKTERVSDSSWIAGNVLYAEEPYQGDKLALGMKSGKFMVVNGDDVGDSEDERDSLQAGGDNDITTSFECLGHASINLEKMKVIDITKDVSGGSRPGQKDFDNFEKNIPQGATYSEYRGGDDDEEIREKTYHRAGSMLVRHEGVSYICGQDEDSYFVSKLKTNPRNVEDAFKALKPRRLVDWEKKTGKQAQRQGEWFFIPAPDLTATRMRRHSLPVNQTGGHKHMVERYEESDGRHYCMGEVEHDDHATLELGSKLHEALQNTALDSWSQEGVD